MRLSDVLLAAAIAVILIALTVDVFGHETHDKKVTEFYKGWMIPPARERSCCNRSDCYHTIIRTQDGVSKYLVRKITSYNEQGPVRESMEQALSTSLWRTIPSKLLEEEQSDPQDSPDGLSHVCAKEAADMGEMSDTQGDWYTLYCAIRGSLQ